jgi:hypothetical protein
MNNVSGLKIGWKITDLSRFRDHTLDNPALENLIPNIEKPFKISKYFKTHAQDIREQLNSILASEEEEKTKIHNCVKSINYTLKKIFGKTFNRQYFHRYTIQFFQEFDQKKIFRFLIDNYRAYQQSQNLELHQAPQKTEGITQIQKSYREALEQSFTNSCKKKVVLNGKKISISPYQARIILYNLNNWINDHKGFLGYQKAGKALGLGPQGTYEIISAMMKAVGEKRGLEQILKWNIIYSSDWTTINNLFNTLNDKNKRDQWITDHQGFKGYKEAGNALELGPKATYQTISAMMKAVGEERGLEEILKWNKIQSSNWTKINNLFDTLNNDTKRNQWIKDHQGFKGYKEAGNALELGPQATYETISAMMKAVGEKRGLEKILEWNQIHSSNWTKINNLFDTLNNDTKRNQWIKDHQGFKGYKEAGKALGLGPQGTYQTISAMMKAVGEKKGLEEILEWNVIHSSDWTTVIKIHTALSRKVLDDELKQSLLLLFSRSKDSPKKIIEFINQHTEKLGELKDLITKEGGTPDYNNVLKELKISPDMLRALFLSYRSNKLKSFAYKVLGAVYLVRPTNDSEEKSGLGSTLESGTDSSNLKQASELLSFLQDHKNLDQGIKEQIHQYLIKEDEKLIDKITTQIPEEIKKEFMDRNND